jgi:23S rRNA (guanosine2251-2'-O)-methyltransferase
MAKPARPGRTLSRIGGRQFGNRRSIIGGRQFGNRRSIATPEGTTVTLQQRGKRPGQRRRDEKRRSRSGDSESAAAGGGAILYGWHTVKAALQNPRRRIRRLLATENASRRLAQENLLQGITPELVRPEVIARRLTADAVHNGVLAEVAPLPSPELEDIPTSGVILLLDQITDPHNVGAIMRTAAAFGAAAIITTARHSPEASGVLAKSASGALEYVPLITVQNLARAMQMLRERGFFIVGLDSAAESELRQTGLRLPLALILGSEGKGLRQRTRETCDLVARLFLPGKVQSLNVSNAAALALYIVTSKGSG